MSRREPSILGISGLPGQCHERAAFHTVGRLGILILLTPWVDRLAQPGENGLLKNCVRYWIRLKTETDRGYGLPLWPTTVSRLAPPDVGIASSCPRSWAVVIVTISFVVTGSCSQKKGPDETHWLIYGRRVAARPRKPGPQERFSGENAWRITLILSRRFFGRICNEERFIADIDPRVKILTLILFVVAVSLLRHFLLITGVYLGVLLLALLSGIPLRFFITRVWLFIPLFSGIIILPAVFNVVVPGDPLITLMKFDGPWSLGPLQIPGTLSITRQGISLAAVFIMRVATSVSLVVLLLLTTRWSHLLKALKVLWIPQMFTFIIGMTYRYIHLLLRIIQDIHLAKKSRVIRKTSVGEGQKWVASQMGNVLTKSLLISDEVYSAMLSRGYAKEVKILDTFRMKKTDYLWTCLSILTVVLMLWLNRM